MLYHKDSKIFYFGNNKPSCRICLHSFEDFPNQVTTLDHFKAKDTLIDGFKKYRINRNLAKILQEDIKIFCHYSDCGAE